MTSINTLDVWKIAEDLAEHLAISGLLLEDDLGKDDEDGIFFQSKVAILELLNDVVENPRRYGKPPSAR